MGNRQTLIALGIAIVLGLAAVWIANSFLTNRERLAYNGATTKVAVASSPLAYGTDITPDKVRFVDYPNSSIPPGAFTNAAQLMPTGKKRIALVAIALNEPILPEKISGIGEGASIAALLPDGMRAASVRINDVSGVAGFVQPNDSVDVLITRSIPGDNGQATDVLIQNVRVIAIDQTAKNADGSPKVGRSATLEVNPLDAQKLALAQEVGTLSLVLRKPGEQNNPVVETISMNDLRYSMYGGTHMPAPAVVGNFGSSMSGGTNRAAAVIAKPSSAPHHLVVRRAFSPPAFNRDVEIYHGTKSEQVKVGVGA